MEDITSAKLKSQWCGRVLCGVMKRGHQARREVAKQASPFRSSALLGSHGNRISDPVTVPMAPAASWWRASDGTAGAMLLI